MWFKFYCRRNVDGVKTAHLGCCVASFRLSVETVCLHRQSLKTEATIGPWFPLSTIPPGIKHKVLTSAGEKGKQTGSRIIKERLIPAHLWMLIHLFNKMAAVRVSNVHFCVVSR